MGTARRDIRRPPVGYAVLLSGLAFLALTDAEGINDPQFKKPVPCAKLSNGNYVWGCSRFYAVCANHKEQSMHCHPNLVLNPDNNQCDDPANVWACQNQQPSALYKAKEPFSCATSPDGNYVAEQCSAHYYVCIGGNRLTRQCAVGTVFNGEQRVCDHIADCKTTAVSHVKPIQLDGSPEADVPPAQPTSTPIPQPASSKVIAAPEVRRRSGNIQQRRWPFFQRRQSASGLPYPPAAPEVNLHAPPPVADTFIVNDENIPDGYNNNNNVHFAAPAPSPIVEFDCVGKSDGVYVIGVNACGQTFWKCANGYAFEYICPAGLYYDAPTIQCTQREFIAACGGTPQATITTTAVLLPEFHCADKSEELYETAPCSPTYAACSGGRSWTLFCPAGLVFQKSSQNCVSAVECSLSGISPAITQQEDVVQPKATQDSVQPKAQSPAQQPSQYKAQSPAQQPAQPSLDPYGQMQPPPSDFVTPPTTTTTTRVPTATKAPFTCAGKPDGYYYKRKCQSAFIVCSKGQISHQQCPDGLLFDPFVANCQYADICGKSTTTPPPTTTTTATPTAIRTTSKPDFNCSRRDNGYYVKQPCTSTFYSCAHSYTIELKCPPLLVFDMNAKLCEYPNVCGTIATTTTTIAPHAYAILTPPSSNPYGSVGSNYYKIRPPAPPQAAPIVAPTTSTAAPTLLPFDCSNKQDDSYAIALCQNAYVICIGGKPIPAKCQSGLVFDGANGFCNYPINCDPNTKPSSKHDKAKMVQDTAAGPLATHPVAYSSPSQPNQPTASNSHGYSAPPASPAPKTSYQAQAQLKKQKKKFSCHGKPDGAYGKACSSKYIRCWHNQTTYVTCQDGLVYDGLQMACVFKNDCGKVKDQPVEGAPQSPHAAVTTATTLTTPASAIDFDCTTDGQFPLGSCQRSYIVCSNGFPNKFPCPGELVYDPAIQQCTYIGDCGKATTQSPVQQDQDGEEEVDQDMSEDDVEFVKADASPYEANSSALPTSDACDDIPKGTHAIAGCSSRYLVCQDGEIKFRTCDNDLIYSQELASCLTAAQVPACKVAADAPPAPSTVAPSTATPYSYGDVPPIKQQTFKRRSNRF